MMVDGVKWEMREKQAGNRQDVDSSPPSRKDASSHLEGLPSEGGLASWSLLLGQGRSLQDGTSGTWDLRDYGGTGSSGDHRSAGSTMGHGGSISGTVAMMVKLGEPGFMAAEDVTVELREPDMMVTNALLVELGERGTMAAVAVVKNPPKNTATTA